MALPPGFLDELRARVSIAAVVGRKVTWDSRKTNVARGDFWAPCPFHQEKTASFHVEEAKGRYYCFGCHAGGDAVTFLRETEGLGFIDAVERLAAEAGMEMPAADPAAAARAAANQGLVEAVEAAVRFYRAQLNGARAAEARAYLDRRGLAPAMRERFEIGYAPDGRSDLSGHLAAKGFAIEVLAQAGLVVEPREGGAPYDRFRNRITFPIRDGRGRAIAFGARAVSAGQEPKYLNSPETPLFDKGRTLYNLGPARAAAAKAGALVVTEGYMDVIALVGAGIEHAVAPLGTAVTEAQLAALWKLAPEPVVALDGDAAGLAAAHRLIDLALPLIAPGRSLRFALLPPGQDPDDVVRAGGGAAMRAILDASRPIVALLWDRESAGQPLDSPERRAALDARLRAHLAKIADAGLRAHWEAEIRSRRTTLYTPPPRPKQDRGSVRARSSVQQPARPSQQPGAARGSLLARQPDGAADARFRESAILSACLNDPSQSRRLEERLERLDFRCPDLAGIRDAILSTLAEPLTSQGDFVEAVARRLGRDPLPELWAANPRRGPWAAREIEGNQLEEALARYAALIGRADEIRDAEADVAAQTDESITLRVRAAAEAEQSANSCPLQDDQSDDETERPEFARVIAAAEASPSRRPRRH
jgi:DNA primase